MTEAQLAQQLPPGAAEPPEEERTYSKDYWDLVFDQLSGKKLFKIGLAILALLYATAIYAPLIASDRPYLLRGIDYKSYRQALRTLPAVSAGFGERLAATFQGDGAAEAVEAELQAARGRVETMKTTLREQDHGPLDAYLGLLERAAASRDEQVALGLVQEAKTAAASIRSEYRARTGESTSGKELVAATSYPLFETITSWEIFFMVLWAFVLTWPLWNRALNRTLLKGDRERIRGWRKLKFAGVFGVSLAAAVLWALTVGGKAATFEAAPYKLALTRGDLVAERAIFPPFGFGYAEIHLAESYRPPTWTATSELDADGHYVRGFRKPRPDSITGYVPPATPVELRYAEPGVNSAWRHPGGTDGLGRDFLVRMIWGGRVSLAVGILSALLLTVIGVLVGSVAGYFGGRVDMAIMRVIEILQSLPAMFLILMAMAFTDPDVVPPIFAIVVVIALIRWTGTARLVRGEFFRLREQEFVLAATALGFSSRRTIFRHVLPNAMSPVLVSAAFAVAQGILTESVVSFLGFGIRHPGASWGSLVNESRSPEHWWIQVFPGLLIFLTVTCYNLVGDAVRDALDPKMKV